jgi:hypothetical protein
VRGGEWLVVVSRLFRLGLGTSKRKESHTHTHTHLLGGVQTQMVQIVVAFQIFQIGVHHTEPTRQTHLISSCEMGKGGGGGGWKSRTKNRGRGWRGRRRGGGEIIGRRRQPRCRGGPDGGRQTLDSGLHRWKKESREQLKVEL